jgi:hypothetical protein
MPMFDEDLAVILYDSDGNEVAIVQGDDGKYRLEVGGNIQVTETGARVAPSALVRQNLLNGSSDDLVVDGSGTSVDFEYEPGSGKSIRVYEVRFVISTGSMRFKNSDFFDRPGPLSNGCLFTVKTGGTEYDLVNFTITEDFLRLPSSAGNFVNFTGLEDLMVMSYPLNVLLEDSNSDFIRMRIRDNLSEGTGYITNTFTATVFGEDVTP